MPAKLLDTSNKGGEKVKRVILLTFILTFSVIATLANDTTFAHGTVDQSAVGSGAGALTINSRLPLRQSFIPSKPTLVAVDVRISTINPSFGADTLTVNIRKGSIGSPILATTSQLVAVGGGSPIFLHFDFPSPLSVIPGDAYILELIATTFTHAVFVSFDNYAGGVFIARGTGDSALDLDFQTYSGGIEVDIDVKPGSDPNSIDCNNEKEVITVAILTTGGFDATTVDHTTVTFEGASETHVDKKSEEPRRHEEDVDGDGDTDLVLHFRLGDTDLNCDSTEAILEGETFGGQTIEGSDAVQMVGG